VSPQERPSRVTESSSLGLSTWAIDDPPQEGAADEMAKPEAPLHKHSDDWRFTLSPYLWMLSVRATADIGPLSTTIDKCFSELVQKLDVGGSLRFEGLHGQWGFYLDGTYLGLSDDANARVGPFTIPGVDIEKELTLSWLDFGALYRLGDDGRSLDFTLGGRYGL
jgi:hypothetical protein